MKTSAQFRLKMRHKRLWMQVKYPNLYKGFSSIMFLCFISGTIAAFFMFATELQPVLRAEKYPQETEITSITGVISAIKDDQFTLRTGKISEENAANRVVYTQKTVKFTAATQISQATFDENGVKYINAANLIDLKPGQEVIVYTKTPLSKENLQAKYVQVLK